MESVSNNPVVAIASYCVSSIVMTLGNKYVLSGVNFNMNCIVLAIQSISCLIVVGALKAAGVVNFRSFNTEDARKWFPISFLLVLMIYTGSKAIQYLSVPVYTIFKNVTIILIAYGEVLWFGGSVTPKILFSFALIVLSSVVAAWSDLSNTAMVTRENLLGYIWMMTNCFSNAAFVLYLRKRIKIMGFTDMDTMFYNNLLSIPVLAVWSLLFEDWSAENVASNFPAASRNSLLILMVITGVLSLGISYCSGWCVRVTSSTTYSMVGALNKLPIAVAGLVFFDSPVTFASVSAIALGFAAGLVYALSKIEQQKQKDTTNVLPTSNKSQ